MIVTVLGGLTQLTGSTGVSMLTWTQLARPALTLACPATDIGTCWSSPPTSSLPASASVREATQGQPTTWRGHTPLVAHISSSRGLLSGECETCRNTSITRDMSVSVLSVYWAGHGRNYMAHVSVLSLHWVGHGHDYMGQWDMSLSSLYTGLDMDMITWYFGTWYMLMSSL